MGSTVWRFATAKQRRLVLPTRAAVLASTSRNGASMKSRSAFRASAATFYFAHRRPDRPPCRHSRYRGSRVNLSGDSGAAVKSGAASVGSYRDPTGAGGIGAPSRSAFVDRRVLLTPDSLPGLFLLSLPSADCFASSPFFGCEAGLNAIGWGAISGAVLAPAPERGHEKSSARPACASRASPRLKTFAATGSDVICC
jgi:hypothetical protein